MTERSKAEQLKTQWNERPDAVEPVTWLHDFWSEPGGARDTELTAIAVAVLDAIADEKNRKQITALQAALTPKQPEAPPGPLQKLLRPVLTRMRSVKTAMQFERVLVTAAEQKAADDRSARPGVMPEIGKQRIVLSRRPFPRPGVVLEAVNRRALDRLAEDAGRYEQVPPAYKDAAEGIEQITITPAIMKENIITAETENGNTQLAELHARFQRMQADMRDAFAADSPGAMAAWIATYRDLLTSLDRENRFASVFDRMPHIARLTNRQWGRRKEGITAAFLFLGEEDTRLDYCLQSLIDSDTYDRHLFDTLADLAPWQTVSARLAQLESIGQQGEEPLSREDTRTLSAYYLQDLAASGAISGVLIEDIVSGKLTTDDLAGMLLTEWLKRDLTEDLSPPATAKAGNESLQKLLHKLKTGLTAFGIRLALAGALLKDPGLLKGGGAELSLGNPFEGGGFGNQKLYDIIWSPRTDTPAYFRLRSSGTYTLDGWQDDVLTIEPDVEQTPDRTQRQAGWLSGKTPKRSKGTIWIPVPYGHLYEGHGHKQHFIDKKSDGSTGIDPASTRDTDWSPGENASFFYHKSPLPLTEQYPWAGPKEIQQLLTSLAVLPADVREALEAVFAHPRTQTEEAEFILDYVENNLIYSLDPKNKAKYDAARKEGMDAVMHTLFTYRKVKCDGAGLAAVALLRSRGIPARLVVGYRVDPRQKTIRTKDAHAWVEYLADGKLHYGDPTPSRMDEVTQRMQASAGFFERLFARERYTSSDYADDISDAETLCASLLREAVPLYTADQAFVVYPDMQTYEKHRARRRAWRAKVTADRAALTALHERQKQEPGTSAELLTALASADVISSTDARRLMLENNLSRMLEPLLNNIYHACGDSAFWEPAFCNKWNYSFSNPIVLRTWIKKLLASTQQILETGITLNPPSLEYIASLRDILETALYEGTRGLYNGDALKKTEFRRDLAEQARKHEGIIDPEMLTTHPLTHVYASYLEAASLLEGDKQSPQIEYEYTD